MTLKEWLEIVICIGVILLCAMCDRFIRIKQLSKPIDKPIHQSKVKKLKVKLP